MEDKFLSLEGSKREKILNAVMNEFANRGYEKASTNEMVKEAGISKGLLFHYFKNKKSLYLYLYDFIMALLQDEFNSKIRYEERDLFKRMKNISNVKLDLQRRFPQMFDFVMEAYLEPAKEVQQEILARSASTLSFNMGKLFQDIDTGMLKEGIELSEVLNIISWSVEGMANEEMRKSEILKEEIDYEKLFEKADKYFELFKKLFYKEGKINECH